jgi:hypothetical protein
MVYSLISLINRFRQDYLSWANIEGRGFGVLGATNSYGNENAAIPYSEELRRILTVGTNTPQTRNYLIGMKLIF